MNEINNVYTPSTTGVPVPPISNTPVGVCPICGRCPHCGHGSYPYIPYVPPSYLPYPYQWPLTVTNQNVSTNIPNIAVIN
jgi:hypothetical protein